MDFGEIIKYLKENLSDYRFRHTLGVADTAKELAAVYGGNEDTAYLAGLLHDIAKELTLDEMRDLCRKYEIAVDELSQSSNALLHGTIGAYLARALFKIDDEIFDAIRYHTTGKKNMSLTTKIIYIADYIEPNRSFIGVDAARELAFSDIDRAILSSLDQTIVHTVNKGIPLHQNTVDARNYLLGCLGRGAKNDKI